MLKPYGFVAPLAFLLRNCAAGARSKSVTTTIGVDASPSPSQQVSHPTSAPIIAVEASESLFPSLYDGAPKAVLVGHSFAHWFGATRCPPPVRVLRATLTEGANRLRLEEPATSGGFGPLCRVSVPPANVWCVCRGDDDPSIRAADLLIAWWNEAGGESAAPDLWTDHLGLDRRLLTRALVELNKAHQRNEALQRSVSTLRDEWACNTRIPPEIIELIENLRLSPPRMIFGSVATEGQMAVPLAELQGSCDAPSTFLVQPLLAGSRGLVGIDIHVAQGVTGSGILLASLYAVDGDCVLADWRIPFADLRPGWLPLRIPTALDWSYRALELRLWSVGSEVERPRLSIVATGLLDELAVKMDAGAEVGSSRGAAPSHMLAVRVWAGLPGMLWDSWRNPDGHPLWGELAIPVFDHTVAQVRPSREFTASFRWFGCLPGGRVLLHPLLDRVAAACLPLPAASALRAVTCEVVMEDRRRRTPIAAKLVIAAPEVAVDQAESEEQVLASSGWTILAQPERRYPLSAPLARPHFGPVNLHLFTRIADGGPDYYGRTVFGRFELRIDSQTTWQMLPVLSEGSE